MVYHYWRGNTDQSLTESFQKWSPSTRLTPSLCTQSLLRWLVVLLLELFIVIDLIQISFETFLTQIPWARGAHSVLLQCGLPLWSIYKFYQLDNSYVWMDLSPPMYSYWLVHHESEITFSYHCLMRRNKYNLTGHQFTLLRTSIPKAVTLYWERKSKPFEKVFKSLFHCKGCRLYQMTLT